MSYREFQPTYNIKIWGDTSFFGRVNCGMSAAMSSLIFLHLAAFLNKILKNNIFHEINNKYWTICCIFYFTACTATWFYMHLKIMGFQNNQTFLATNIFFRNEHYVMFHFCCGDWDMCGSKQDMAQLETMILFYLLLWICCTLVFGCLSNFQIHFMFKVLMFCIQRCIWLLSIFLC